MQNQQGNHKETKHHLQGSKVCKDYGKSFSSVSNLRHHEFIYKGLKAYQCQECGKRFSSKFNLKQHNVVHTGEKPYVCDVCGQRFTQSSSMKTHKRLKHI